MDGGDDGDLSFLQETENADNAEWDDELFQRVYVDFAFKFSEEETEIQNLRAELETAEGEEDKEWFQHEIGQKEKRLALLRQLLQSVPLLDEQELDSWCKRNPFQIPLAQRWMMYISWRKKVVALQEKRADLIEEKYHRYTDRIKELRALESAEICQNADVVGLTTTGAARQRELLEHLKPTIGKIIILHKLHHLTFLKIFFL